MAKVDKAPKSNKNKGLNERVVVLMTAEQRAWIQAHSETTGVPVTAILRRAIEQYRQGIARKAAKRPSRLMEHTADLAPTEDPLTF